MATMLRWVFIIAFLALSWSDAESAEPKLQVGVLKRAEECTNKARRGDLLHMHYTVNFHMIIAEISYI